MLLITVMRKYEEEERMTKEEYRRFINNPENLYNCANCPENRNEGGWQSRLPCGQWHCWVDLHCGESIGMKKQKGGGKNN